MVTKFLSSVLVCALILENIQLTEKGTYEMDGKEAYDAVTWAPEVFISAVLSFGWLGQICSQRLDIATLYVISNHECILK
jgi:hypothetical protein